MDYKLNKVQLKLQQFADKMGSDYFPLPVLLNYFHTATYEFIKEKLKIMEKTQEGVDEIRPLIVPGKLTIEEDPNDVGVYIAAVPVKYMRLVRYSIIYPDGSKSRMADVMRQAEYTTAVLNPNRKPTKLYPIILQENNLFQVDAGGEVPEAMDIRYCKKPSFATTGQPNTRIVNLPDEAIENILLITVTRLFASTGDQRSQSNFQLEEAFNKTFK